MSLAEQPRGENFTMVDLLSEVSTKTFRSSSLLSPSWAGPAAAPSSAFRVASPGRGEDVRDTASPLSQSTPISLRSPLVPPTPAADFPFSSSMTKLPSSEVRATTTPRPASWVSSAAPVGLEAEPRSCRSPCRWTSSSLSLSLVTSLRVFLRSLFSRDTSSVPPASSPSELALATAGLAHRAVDAKIAKPRLPRPGKRREEESPSPSPSRTRAPRRGGPPFPLPPVQRFARRRVLAPLPRVVEMLHPERCRGAGRARISLAFLHPAQSWCGRTLRTRALLARCSNSNSIQT